MCVSSHLASESILCDYLVVIFHLTCTFPEGSVSTETWKVAWINVVVLKLVCTQSMVYIFLLLIVWHPAILVLLGKNIVFVKVLHSVVRMSVERVVDLFKVYTGLKITDIHFRMLAGTPVYEPQQHREFRRETSEASDSSPKRSSSSTKNAIVSVDEQAPWL
jgi:hypothetical protein